MQKVFISYARADESDVRQIATALQDVNIPIWMDIFDIQAGDNWRDAIQIGLNESDVMILAVTSASMASKQVGMEWQYFLDEGKPVIPMILESSSIHFQLKPLQHINFQDQSFDEAIKQLITALNQAYQPQLTPHDAKTLDMFRTAHRNWLSFDRADNLLLNPNQIKTAFSQFTAYEQLSQNLWRFLLTSGAVNDIVLQNYPLLITALDDLARDIQQMILSTQLTHPSPIVRIQTAHLIWQMTSPDVRDDLLEALNSEQDETVASQMLLALIGMDIPIEPERTRQIFDKTQDWTIKTQLLAQMPSDTQSVLFVTDGSELATDFRQMLGDADFTIVDIQPQEMFMMPVLLPKSPADILMTFNLIVLMRGEHYNSTSSNMFYNKLTDYVSNGGVLFATSWVGWESKDNPLLAQILPFKYQSYHENVTLTCIPTDEGLSENIFTDTFAIMTSYETLVPYDDAMVMLTTTSNNPIFGYRYIREGRTFYLNSCQHSCTKQFDAQTRSSKEFRQSFGRFFEWLKTQI